MPVTIPYQSPFPNVYNFSPSNLKTWRKALATARIGGGSARISCIGDSTFYGVGSNGSASGNLPPLSMPTQLANLFTAAGMIGNAQSFWSCGNSGSQGSLYTDSRVTFTGSVAGNAGLPTFGGYFIQINSGGTLSFKPTVNVDTFKVWYAVGPSNGTLSLDINGSGTTSYSSTATAAVGSQTITGTLGSNTVNIKYVSGGGVFIIGVEAYNSAQSRIDIFNAGWAGATSINWNNTGNIWAPVNFVQNNIGAHLTLLCVGINDWDGPTAMATYITNLQALITAAKTSGDVILVTPTPSNPGAYASVATQQTYITAMYGLAATNNIPLIDIWARWQSYAVSNALGIYNDSLHPNGAGYADQAQAIRNVLLSV